MKYLKTGLIAVLLMVGLLSCVNSNDSSSKLKQNLFIQLLQKLLL